MGRIGYFVNDDNAGASEDELLARDRLAHELMYFSRGNPVIYYGDEQGFTGTGGDQAGSADDVRQSGPRIPGRRSARHRQHPRAGQLQSEPSAVRAASSNLPSSPKRIRHCATARTKHRYSSDEAGIYAFSRLHRGQQREYVVALNNSESEKTAAIPTYVGNGSFVKVYGSGPEQLTSNENRLLTVTVPALSTVVYEIGGPDSAIRCSAPDLARQSDHLGREQLTDAGVGQRWRFLLQ